MSKAPAFQMYSGDFLTGTMLMSNAEVGLYIRLLLLQAEHGTVPDSVDAICGAFGESSRILWPSVRQKFKAGPTDGTMVNERMEVVLAARDAFRARQSEKGKASASKRKGSTVDEPRINHGSTVVEPIEDRDRDTLPSGKERARQHPLQGEVKDEAPVSVPMATPQSHEANLWPSFSDFWEAYGKSRGKPLAMQAWAKVSQADREAIMAALPAYTAANEKQYRLDPVRYLKYRAWEDEVIPRNTPINGKPTEEQRFAEYGRILAERYPNQ